MDRARLGLAVVLVALLAAVAVGVLRLDRQHQGDSAPGPHAVEVVGPDGLLWNGTVMEEDATAYSVLVAAAQAGGFGVDVRDSDGFGDKACSGLYVVAIAGYAEDDRGGGWDYHVRSSGGTWEWQPYGAACYGLAAGEDVRWLWVGG